MMFKVRDRKTQVEREVTQAAYAAKGPKVYEKLGIVGQTTESLSSPNPNPAQVSRSVKAAAPVVVKTQLVTPKPAEEQTKTEEPTNQEPTAPTEPTQAAPAPPVAKNKPGPKPGSTRKKSISSNPTTDEE